MSPRPKRRTKYARLRATHVRKGGLLYPEYKAWIASQPCIVCASRPVEVAHVGDRAFGQRCSDWETLPICVEHHRTGRNAVHGALGKNFWVHHGLNREALIAEFQRRYAERKKAA